MNALRHEGHDLRTAILQGNRDRLRPILMTTLALVGGMLPLWVGTGPGSEERRAIAVVVIGGQTLSLLLTLLVTPVAYLLLHDLVRMLRRRRRAPAASAAPPPHHAAEAPAGIAVASHASDARNGGARPQEGIPAADVREIAPPPVPGKLETQSP
jgi:hypothetical protein